MGFFIWSKSAFLLKIWMLNVTNLPTVLLVSTQGRETSFKRELQPTPSQFEPDEVLLPRNKFGTRRAGELRDRKYDFVFCSVLALRAGC